MDQSLKISKRIDAIREELMVLAKQERELLKEQKRLVCEMNHGCSVMDLINGIQMGTR
tara:strand:- start:7 stop:180 length:174 start_codon:yes stop_codon:yes gene_type:complete